jgi:hypothetical protein
MYTNTPSTVYSLRLLPGQLYFLSFCPPWCGVTPTASPIGCDLIASNSTRIKPVMVCSSARRTSSLPSDPVDIAGIDISLVSTVRDLGVFIDCDLGAAAHVRMVVSSYFATLRQLRQLRQFVSDDCSRSLVVACTRDSTTALLKWSGRQLCAYASSNSSQCHRSNEVPS